MEYLTADHPIVFVILAVAYGACILAGKLLLAHEQMEQMQQQVLSHEPDEHVRVYRMRIVLGMERVIVCFGMAGFVALLIAYVLEASSIWVIVASLVVPWIKFHRIRLKKDGLP